MEHPSGQRLKWSKFSAAYRTRLIEGATALSWFLKSKNIRWEAIGHSKAKAVDELLEIFVNELHDTTDRGALRKAKHGVLYVQAIRPRLREALQGTWQVLQAWEVEKPSSYRAPMPLPLMAAVVCEGRKSATETPDRKMKDSLLAFTTLVMVAFFGLLRPGEVCGIQVADVSLPNGRSFGGPFAVIRLPQPKNARAMGAQQFTEVRHPDAVNWLAWLVRSRRSPSKRLWVSGTSAFRAMFRSICRRLELDSLRLSPASLRAGGATCYLDQKMEVARVRFLGRWSNLRSLEHYLQVARAQQIAINLSPRITRRLKELLMSHFFMLALPHFLAKTLDPEDLLASRLREPLHVNHVVAALRSWGNIAETVPSSYCDGRQSAWSEVPGHWMERPSEGSEKLQE